MDIHNVVMDDHDGIMDIHSCYELWISMIIINNLINDVHISTMDISVTTGASHPSS